MLRGQHESRAAHHTERTQQLAPPPRNSKNRTQLINIAHKINAFRRFESAHR